MCLLTLPRRRRTFNYSRPKLYTKQFDAIFQPKDYLGGDARYSLIEASTKSGKTVGCMAWLFEQAFMSGKQGLGRNYWWIAPVYPVAEIVFRRLKLGLPSSLYEANEGKLTLSLPNGATIWCKSADKPDSLYGDDVWAAVMDEASRTKPEAWYAVRSTLTATRGPFRAIGNVKGRRNWFFELCRRAEMGETGMAYYKIIAADAIAAGVLVQEEVEDAKSKLPDAVFRELYLAQPSDDAGNPFGFKYIDGCVSELSAKEPVAWGWDLGKSVDWTVGIALDEDGVACQVERFQKPWPETEDTIIRMTGNAPALVDSTGLGDPVLDHLQASFTGTFEGYKFSPASKQKLMEGLAVAIQRQNVRFPDGVVKKELESFEYEYTRTGVHYSAPEGYHDDCVCALALAVQCKGTNNDVDVWNKFGAAMRGSA